MFVGWPGALPRSRCPLHARFAVRTSERLMQRIVSRLSATTLLAAVAGAQCLTVTGTPITLANADDAWERITAGASLVQLYSAMVFEGPDIGRVIAQGLADHLEREGLSSITEAVGSAA